MVLAGNCINKLKCLECNLPYRDPYTYDSCGHCTCSEHLVYINGYTCTECKEKSESVTRDAKMMDDVQLDNMETCYIHNQSLTNYCFLCLEILCKSCVLGHDLSHGLFNLFVESGASTNGEINMVFFNMVKEKFETVKSNLNKVDKILSSRRENIDKRIKKNMEILEKISEIKDEVIKSKFMKKQFKVGEQLEKSLKELEESSNIIKKYKSTKTKSPNFYYLQTLNNIIRFFKSVSGLVVQENYFYFDKVENNNPNFKEYNRHYHRLGEFSLDSEKKFVSYLEDEGLILDEIEYHRELSPKPILLSKDKLKGLFIYKNFIYSPILISNIPMVHFSPNYITKNKSFLLESFLMDNWSENLFYINGEPGVGKLTELFIHLQGVLINFNFAFIIQSSTKTTLEQSCKNILLQYFGKEYKYIIGLNDGLDTFSIFNKILKKQKKPSLVIFKTDESDMIEINRIPIQEFIKVIIIQPFKLPYKSRGIVVEPLDKTQFTKLAELILDGKIPENQILGLFHITKGNPKISISLLNSIKMRNDPLQIILSEKYGKNPTISILVLIYKIRNKKEINETNKIGWSKYPFMNGPGKKFSKEGYSFELSSSLFRFGIGIACHYKFINIDVWIFINNKFSIYSIKIYDSVNLNTVHTPSTILNLTDDKKNNYKIFITKENDIYYHHIQLDVKFSKWKKIKTNITFSFKENCQALTIIQSNSYHLNNNLVSIKGSFLLNGKEILNRDENQLKMGKNVFKRDHFFTIYFGCDCWGIYNGEKFAITLSVEKSCIPRSFINYKGIIHYLNEIDFKEDPNTRGKLYITSKFSRFIGDIVFIQNYEHKYGPSLSLMFGNLKGKLLLDTDEVISIDNVATVNLTRIPII
ncbi:hypothetical protein CYY_000377 [Polysphondylium violaceum]|uniref:B box-type domain-containing protein n=1 Tax=Polysphondylium violaceum TaxID=133409 RepID=A0A8J4V2G0_9MYCE|nr:hypothetical protein CYY_000377 [Polysphondylium violaceum]